MRKAIAIAMAMLLMILCCACGETEKPSNNTSSNNSNSSSQGSLDSSSDTSSEQDEEHSPTQSTTTTPGSVELGDSPILENYITVDNGLGSLTIEPEFGTQPATLDTGWNATAPIKKGNTDKEAEKLRNEILSAKNTEEIYEITGTTYYVSPNGNDANDGITPETAFKTTNADIFTRNILKPGDAVLFERGGLWRLISAIKCKPGVTYGSYGKGEKPTFYGSAYNYANEDFWTPSTKKNIWKVSVADTDIGIVVLNHGELVGFKKLNGLIALEKNGDFYFNRGEDTLYFYYDGGNPGKAFDDIEIGLRKNIFSVTSAENVTIDNLRIKYSGLFGVSLDNCDNSTITNCEIGFIGGAIQSGTTRLGNGIQVWNGVINHRVENCWIYQIYDAAVTFQGDNTYTGAAHMSDIYKNITYANNLFEYSIYSVEFWHGNSAPSVSLAVIENFNCVNNISRFAGYGWGDQRADFTGNHICVFDRSFPNAKNNNITDNLFDLANSFIVKWGFISGADMSGFNISNNTYYHGKNRFNEAVRFSSWNYASNLAELQNAIAKFDSNPKKIVWVD